MSDDINTREQLEADANLLRERLARNLESLDARRHEAFDVKAQVVKHPLPVMVMGAASLFLIAGGSGLLAYRLRKKNEPWQRFLDGVAALSQAIHHPEKIEKQDSIGSEIFRGVTVSIGTFVASQMAKRALHKFMPELWQEPRPIR